MNREPMASFHEVLAWFRRDLARLTQRQLADRAKISAQCISKLELGKSTRPRRATVALLAEILTFSDEGSDIFEQAADGQLTISKWKNYQEILSTPEALRQTHTIYMQSHRVQGRSQGAQSPTQITVPDSVGREDNALWPSPTSQNVNDLDGTDLSASLPQLRAVVSALYDAVPANGSYEASRQRKFEHLLSQLLDYPAHPLDDLSAAWTVLQQLDHCYTVLQRLAGFERSATGKEYTTYKSQSECEEQIAKACAAAKRVKILTVRGARYFFGKDSLLRSHIDRKTGVEYSIQVLVLSQDSAHITEGLASNLSHPSADQIREKMGFIFRHTLQPLSEQNKNVEVKTYTDSPQFKVLIFDDTMFVSSVVGPKSDDRAEMVMMTRAQCGFFAGYEAYFDLLWRHSI